MNGLPDWLKLLAKEAPDMASLLSVCRTYLGLDGAFAPPSGERFIELATLHRSVLMVAEAADGTLDPYTYAKLKKRAFALSARHALLQSHLKLLLQAMNERAINPVLYKGPVLGKMLYGGEERREYDDIDLYIERPKLDAARRALLQLGYTPVRLSCEGDVALMDRFGTEQDYVSASTGLHIQIGSQPVEPHISGRWRSIFRLHCETVSIAGVSVKSLCAPAMAAFLAVHGAKHLWGRVQWLVDFGLLWRRLDEGERRQAKMIARRCGALRMLEQGIRRWSMLADAHPGSRDSGAEMLQTGLQWARGGYAGEDNLRLFLRHVRLQQNGLWRLRCLFSFAFNPSPADWQRIKLPLRLAGLYPLFRIARLMLGRSLHRRQDNDEGR